MIKTLFVAMLVLFSGSANSTMYNFQSSQELAQNRYNRHLESQLSSRIKRIVGHNGFVIHVFATLNPTQKKKITKNKKNYKNKILLINDQIAHLSANNSNSSQHNNRSSSKLPGMPDKRFNVATAQNQNRGVAGFLLDGLFEKNPINEPLFHDLIVMDTKQLLNQNRNRSPGVPDNANIPHINNSPQVGLKSLPGFEMHADIPMTSKKNNPPNDKIKALKNIKRMYQQKSKLKPKTKNRLHRNYYGVKSVKIDVLLDESVSLEKEEFISHLIIERAKLLKNPANSLSIVRARFDYKTWSNGYIPPPIIFSQPPIIRKPIVIQQQQSPPPQIIKIEPAKQEIVKKIYPEIQLPEFIKYWWIGLLIILFIWFVSHRLNIRRSDEQHRRMQEMMMLQNKSQVRYIN